MADNNSNGYFFLSHSSRDIEKVREIRNLIENEKGNPILFYLKCLDGDNPLGEDKEQLKGLISREILARKKFILCKSKYTETPLSSEWIEWEKAEVRKLQKNNNEIQVYEIDIENNDDYLQNVKEIVRKQRKILLVAPYELREEGMKIKLFLTRNDLHVESFVEDGDIHTDLQYRMGQFTKEIVKGQIQEVASKSGIVVLINSGEMGSSTFLQMAYAFVQKYNCSIKGYDVRSIDEIMLKHIYLDIVELINS